MVRIFVLTSFITIACQYSFNQSSKKHWHLPYHQKDGLATMDNFSKQIYEAGINDGRAEVKAESIKNLMSTLNVSIDQAMDILKTPPEEHQYFKDLLAKEL